PIDRTGPPLECKRGCADCSCDRERALASAVAMLFYTPQFGLFLVVVIMLFGWLRGRFILPLLVAASLFFYGYFNAFYLAVFVAVAIADYYLALWGRASRDKRAPIIVSALLNFGLLCYFKYA